MTQDAAHADLHAALASLDPEKLFRARQGGHNGALGTQYRGHGADWVELALPWSEQLVGDEERGVMASGAILALMDMACGSSVWLKVGGFVPQATLDLRVDYLRPARRGATVIGRAECYRLTRSIAFARGQAHDGDADDPVAHVAATFMFTGKPR